MKRILNIRFLRSEAANCGGLSCVRSLFRSVLVLAACAIVPSGLFGQQPKPSEYQIKAIYLYNFSKFVEWPPAAALAQDEPFPICVLGKDPFGPVLDTILSGEDSAGKRYVARRISRPQDAASCRILFVAASEEGRLKEVVAAVDKLSVLTVSDIPRFSQRGGMIQFLLDGDKVRFEVNLTNATDAGLILSSDLLKVAVTVRKNSQPGD
jgi:YfiR/HmsC-like